MRTVTGAVTQSTPRTSSNRLVLAQEASNTPASDDKTVLLATIRGSNAAAQALIALVDTYSLGHGQDRQPVAIGDRFEYQILIRPGSTQSRWILGLGPDTRHGNNKTSGEDDYFRLRPRHVGPFWDSHVEAIGQDHLRIILDCQSGAVLLQSLSCKPTLIMRGSGDAIHATLRVDGSPSSDNLSSTTSKTSMSWLLRELKTRIQIGPFDFTLELPWHGPERQAALERACNMLVVRRGYYPSARVGMFFILETLCNNGEYRAQPKPKSAGLSYQVSGVHCKTGKPARIVALTYNASTYHSVRDAIGNLRRLGGEAETGVLGLRDTWCEHKHGMCWRLQQWEPPRDFSDTIYYSAPLPENDFGRLRWSLISPTARMAYFHQTLVGLAKIHAEGMIHGTIRPHALVVVPIVAPSSIPDKYDLTSVQLRLRAAITDLASATEGPTRYDQPPLEAQQLFSAPEVRSSSSQKPYTYSADIWSLAMTWLSTFGPLPYPTEPLDWPAYSSLRQSLTTRLCALAGDRHIHREFTRLVVAMTMWDPRERATMTEALHHPVWKPLLGGNGDAQVREGVVAREDVRAREGVAVRQDVGAAVRHDQREDDESDGLGEEEREHGRRRKRVRIQSPIPSGGSVSETDLPPIQPVSLVDTDSFPTPQAQQQAGADPGPSRPALTLTEPRIVGEVQRTEQTEGTDE